MAVEGFPEERIQSLFHQIELEQKHVTGKFNYLKFTSLPYLYFFSLLCRRHSLIKYSYSQFIGNFGLGVASGIMSTWIHGGDPIRLLKVDEFLSYIRSKLQEGPFFSRLIEKHMLNNPHRVTLGRHFIPHF